MKNNTENNRSFMAKRININGGPEKARILVHHWRWLESQGPSYKQQAASCKQQAASLTRRLNSVIGVYRRKNYENK
jgi:hypothetical protein